MVQFGRNAASQRQISGLARKPAGSTMTAQRGSSLGPNAQRKYVQHNSKRTHIIPYRKGIAVTSTNSIAAKRPVYLNNKCLVVSRIDRDTTIPQLQAYVNERSGKNIKFLYEPKNLAYEYARWRTIAIELSDEDYDLLSKPEFWEANIRIRDFVGRRWWRNPASNLSANERQNSIRQQWTL